MKVAQENITRKKTQPIVKTNSTYVPEIVSGGTKNQTAINALQASREQAVYAQQQNAYDLQRKNATDAYNLAMQQYGQQENEQKMATERAGQQAYVARKQAERVSGNVLQSQGLSNTGYEQTYRNALENTYGQQQRSLMDEYNNALSAIQRSRESQKMNYEQSMSGINMNQQNAQSQYVYEQQLSKLNNNISKAKVLQPNELYSYTRDQVFSAVQQAYDNKQLTKDQANAYLQQYYNNPSSVGYKGRGR